jgi:hypothetical protein
MLPRSNIPLLNGNCWLVCPVSGILSICLKATIHSLHRPQAADVCPLQDLRPVISKAGEAAELPGRAHCQHLPHPRQGECGSGHAIPPAFLGGCSFSDPLAGRQARILSSIATAQPAICTVPAFPDMLDFATIAVHQKSYQVMLKTSKSSSLQLRAVEVMEAAYSVTSLQVFRGR